MLNYLWSFMILIAIVWGAVHGNLDAVTQGMLDSSKEAVALGITMLGIMSFWSGILEVGNGAGLLTQLTRFLSPVLRFLFPNLEEDHPARHHIAVNMIANVLGLGWAATPAGLSAMEELKKRNGNSEIASNEMCTFLIINISSLQLIPMNMIAYRNQFGSADPAMILAPALLATTASTMAGVIFCKLKDRRL